MDALGGSGNKSSRPAPLPLSLSYGMGGEEEERAARDAVARSLAVSSGERELFNTRSAADSTTPASSDRLPTP